MRNAIMDGPDEQQLSETDLYDLWTSVLPGYSPLRTRKGDRLKVLSPGRRAAGPGPDFRGCILDVEGEIWTGDAEIHVDEGDWDRHGHTSDPAFENLLLHICFRPAEHCSAPDRVRRTVVIDRQKAHDELYDPDAGLGLFGERNGTCAVGRTVQDHPEQARRIIERLERFGRRRFRRRAEEVRNAFAGASHRRSVFARVLLSCMGLYRNRQQARTLANALSFDRFHRVLDREEDPAAVQVSGEAWILGRAGLLEESTGLFDSPRSGEWHAYRERLRAQAGLPEQTIDCSWDRTGTRPVNTPYRRLAGFVVLFRRFLLDRSVYRTEEFLIQHILENSPAVDGREPAKADTLLEPLTVDTEEVTSHWNDHSAPGRRLSRPSGLVGMHRAGVIWINGLAPYLAALSEVNELNRLEEAIETLNRSSSLPVGDHRVNRVRQFLFGRHEDHVPLTLYVEQGMHGLYKGNCRFGSSGCSRCELRRHQ